MTADLLAQALERIADPKNTHFAGDAQVVAREALAAHRSQTPAEGDAAERFSITEIAEAAQYADVPDAYFRSMLIALGETHRARKAKAQPKGTACAYPKCDGDEPAQGECCKRPAATLPEYTGAMGEAAQAYIRSLCGPNWMHTNILPATFRWSDCWDAMRKAAAAE